MSIVSNNTLQQNGVAVKNGNPVVVIGAGLAGSEAALQLAERNYQVKLFEMRPQIQTAVHKTDQFAELVCSNSLKSTKPESAAGMLKSELASLNSYLYKYACKHAVAAGGALAVNRESYSFEITQLIESHPLIEVLRSEVTSIADVARDASAVIVASGPLTSDALAADLQTITGEEHMAFYDAAAPIVMADSLDFDKLFVQSRYEESTEAAVGDYLNAPFTQDEYDAFIRELIAADRVIAKSFETKDLFSACQPIEEIARKGHDAPRFGTLKPVGLTDPRTGKRPWAVLQLRAEDKQGQSFNLVGFQTNLTFGEQRRVFRMIPGLEHAEFARFGVMHRNTFINAPQLLDRSLRLVTQKAAELPVPVFVAGQLAGTEGYAEAIRSGLHVALEVSAYLRQIETPVVPKEMVFGALLAYATDVNTVDYQPMHVNFGIIEPLEVRIKNKGQRYQAYAERGLDACVRYCEDLRELGLL